MNSTPQFKIRILISLAGTLQKQLLSAISVWGGGGRRLRGEKKKKIKRSSYSSLPNKPSHSCTSASEQLLYKHTTGLLSCHRVCSGHPHVAWIKKAGKLHYGANRATGLTGEPTVLLVNILSSAPSRGGSPRSGGAHKQLC